MAIRPWLSTSGVVLPLGIRSSAWKSHSNEGVHFASVVSQAVLQNSRGGGKK